MSEGRIRKALSGFYYVDTGSEVLTCRARGKFRKEGISPLVGDRVEVRELGNGEGFVEAILPRKNAFSRPAVANIDQLVVKTKQRLRQKLKGLPADEDLTRWLQLLGEPLDKLPPGHMMFLGEHSAEDKETKIR